MSITIDQIAHIETDFPEKFGVPRQSGLCSSIGKIIFEETYRVAEALRGIEGYSHLWLIFGFSEAHRTAGEWSPTVRPPRLGGNRRVGVFATRSPFRPNGLGLSSVRLLGTERDPQRGTVLLVGGADLVSGTPIYDIKPYLAFTDSHPDAVGGFSDDVRDYRLAVRIAPAAAAAFAAVAEDVRTVVTDILTLDPRPSYQDAPDRTYFLRYADREYAFTVADGTLTVTDIRKIP